MYELLMSMGVYLPMGLVGLAMLTMAAAVWYSWPWLSGVIGEARVRKVVERFRSEAGEVLHDVILPDRKGGTVQIDHLVISRYGITAVETYVQPGKILGAPRDATWVQESHGNIYRFTNPLRQNDALVEVLKSTLGPKFPIDGAVVFTAASLQGSTPENVVSVGKLRACLLSRGRDCFSSEKVARTANAIRNVSIHDAETKRKHNDEFMNQQGLNERLRAVNLMLGASAALMMLAILIVVATVAVQTRLI